MASNKDLIKSIVAINPDAKTDGLNNNKLAEMLKGLKAQPIQPESEAVEPRDPAPVVAAGQSITTKRGILGPGEEIGPDDLGGGMESLVALHKAGYVVEG
jgi:hypothetical protein